MSFSFCQRVLRCTCTEKIDGRILGMKRKRLIAVGWSIPTIQALKQAPVKVEAVKRPSTDQHPVTGHITHMHKQRITYQFVDMVISSPNTIN